VTDAAIELIDEAGPHALTLAAVADRTGVTAPSLYKHVRNLAELGDRVAVRVLDELTDWLGAAVMGRSGEDAVSAAMWAWRQYVLKYPHRYGALPQVSVTGSEDLDAAGGRLLDVMMSMLRGYGLSGSTAIHIARCFRSSVHGFCALEAAGGFGLPEDLDASYRHLVHMLCLGLSDVKASEEKE
jgi:AcrR family transcriptional regulator